MEEQQLIVFSKTSTVKKPFRVALKVIAVRKGAGTDTKTDEQTSYFGKHSNIKTNQGNLKANKGGIIDKDRNIVVDFNLTDSNPKNLKIHLQNDTNQKRKLVDYVVKVELDPD